MAKRSQVIVDDYLRKIVRGEIAEGESLPTETVLIERYSVSRTAVREAIQALAAKGFVRIRQGSGTTVASRTEWNVLDPDYLEITGFGAAMLDNLLEARAVLEPEIAAMAAVRAQPEDVRDLRRIVAEMSAAPRADAAAHEELEAAFHHRLAECSDNPVLISLHDSMWHLARGRRPAVTPAALDRVAYWHDLVVDAVAAGEPDSARAAMRLHLRPDRDDQQPV